ncbi:unnamed protein product [Notodromas monacha]|uniref:Uncharacterized protein n=1 Tax=Notodromas monacha TaxID=399045 RepID=A0A7R9BWK5_9CRUS|nr:unnamed protein product [Notodromas monacha]CAG0922131.1 unnamed protein product [Notodromas monacha]
MMLSATRFVNFAVANLCLTVCVLWVLDEMVFQKMSDPEHALWKYPVLIISPVLLMLPSFVMSYKLLTSVHQQNPGRQATELPPSYSTAVIMHPPSVKEDEPPCYEIAVLNEEETQDTSLQQPV